MELKIAEQRAVVARGAARLAVKQNRAAFRPVRYRASVAREIIVPRRVARGKRNGLEMADGVGQIADPNVAERLLGKRIGDQAAIGDLPIGDRRTGLAEKPRAQRIVHGDNAFVVDQPDRGLGQLVWLIGVGRGQVGGRAIARIAQHLLLARDREERLHGKRALHALRQVVAERAAKALADGLVHLDAPIPKHVADRRVAAVPDIVRIAVVQILPADELALFGQADGANADRERYCIRRAATDEMAGRAGNIAAAAQDGIEKQHLPETVFRRDRERRRLKRRETTRPDHPIQRFVQLRRLHHTAAEHQKPRDQPRRKFHHARYHYAFYFMPRA